MSRKAKINNLDNNILNTEIKNNTKEDSFEIKETEQYQIDSIKEMKDSSVNKHAKIEGDEEEEPLIINKKLIKIFNNLNENIENNINQNIEDIYDNYHNKRENKKTIKQNISKCCIWIMFFIIAVIFVIINSMAIFTSKAILES